MHLENYYGKYVKLIDSDNATYTGYVYDFEDKREDDNEYDLIAISPYKGAHYGLGFYENEIKFITEIHKNEVRKWASANEVGG